MRAVTLVSERFEPKWLRSVVVVVVAAVVVVVVVTIETACMH